MLAAERRAAVREARMAEERRRLHEAQLAAKALLVRVRVRDPNRNPNPNPNPDPNPNPNPKPKPNPNQEHLLVSASYDNTVRLFDTQTGTAVLTIENMNKCRFSALCWHAAHQARPLRNP